MAESAWAIAGRGCNHRRQRYRCLAWCNVSAAIGVRTEAADTVRDPCWRRQDLTWEHNLGLCGWSAGTCPPVPAPGWSAGSVGWRGDQEPAARTRSPCEPGV